MRLAANWKTRIWLGGLAGIYAILICALLAGATTAQAQQLPKPSAVASPKADVSPTLVPRGSTFDVNMVVGIMAGFHVNAHKPSEDYLIPTTLTAKLPAGFKELGTSYPPGMAKKLSFTDKQLLVYTGKFTVHAKFAAEGNAPLGKVKLPFTLQYQACNDSVCLPPVRIPVTATIDVAPATKARRNSP